MRNLTICLLLLLASTAWAGSLTVRPTADGTNDSASFYLNSTSANPCTTSNCYTGVYETTGASCATPVASDGSSSYVYSAASGAKQSFTVDISSIPAGNTIHSVQVYVCAQRGASGNSAKLLTIIGGTEYDCASTFTAGTSYASFNCTLTVGQMMTAGKTAEIGVLMSATKGVYFSTFVAVVTYAPSMVLRHATGVW